MRVLAKVSAWRAIKDICRLHEILIWLRALLASRFEPCRLERMKAQLAGIAVPAIKPIVDRLLTLQLILLVGLFPMPSNQRAELRRMLERASTFHDLRHYLIHR